MFVMWKAFMLESNYVKACIGQTKSNYWRIDQNFVVISQINFFCLVFSILKKETMLIRQHC